MSRGFLKFLAVLLTVLIVIVLFAGLDDLPRGLRAQIAAERTAFTQAQKQLQDTQGQIERDLASEAELFRAVPASQQWPAAISRAAAGMATAGGQMAELTQLEKRNRRTDRQRAESLLTQERGARGAATAAIAAIRADETKWIDLKRNLPAVLQQMDANHNAIHAFDLGPVTEVVTRAGSDWPEKKPDLDSRLNSLRGLVGESDSIWNGGADARRRAAAGDLSEIALVGADSAGLKSRAADIPKQAEELKALAGQLYTAWDKVLVDMEVRGTGTNRSWDQKIRTVKTQVANATAKGGNTSSDDKWVDVSQAIYESQKSNLGMAVEHKSAGRYDSEAERTAQPAGFAYMAPPSQGSNQYGYWERRDGRDFWVFYGQYALLRDLLFNHDYRPLDRGDWDGYRTSRERGSTYYGNDTQTGGQRYGSSGSATQQRYSGSTYAQGGGFKDSQYASKPGGYRDSQYATPGMRNGGDTSPRTFGRNRDDEPHVSRPPAPSYRPSPRPAPSFRPPMRSPGRTFGRRR